MDCLKTLNTMLISLKLSKISNINLHILIGIDNPISSLSVDRDRVFEYNYIKDLDRLANHFFIIIDSGYTKYTKTEIPAKIILEHYNIELGFSNKFTIVIIPEDLPTNYYDNDDTMLSDTTSVEGSLQYSLRCNLVERWIDILKNLTGFLEKKPESKLFIYNDAVFYGYQPTKIDERIINLDTVQNRNLSRFCELGYILHLLQRQGYGRRVYTNLPNNNTKSKKHYTMNNLNTITNLW
jgi:hypothetical protein